MVNWYYVRGSERVGPVSVEVLRDLFNNQELNLESYVWRKGFQNWERLKDVSELDFSGPAPVASSAPKKATPTSPEVEFKFDWKKIREDEELFFVKIGSDRKHYIDEECYGPYSVKELREALDDKRINYKTLIYAIGLPGWIEAGETPLNPVHLDIDSAHIKSEAPLLLVMENNPLPLVALVDKAGTKECSILGSGPLKEAGVKLCSIYTGRDLKAKNLKVSIEDYDPKQQRAVCKIVELGEEARNVIENYA